MATPTTSILLPTGLIAYLDLEQHIGLVQSDGTVRQTISCEGEARSPVWSPDGRELTYICTSLEAMLGQAMRYDVTSQHSHTIGPATEHLSHLAWSPDELYIILDAGTSIVRHLQVLDVSSEQVIFDIEALGYAWSPDGHYLATGQRQPLDAPISIEPLDSVSLAIWNIEQAHPTIVFTGSSEVLYFPQAWLPDGRLLFDRLEWDEGTMNGKHTLWTVTFTGDKAGSQQPAIDIPPVYDRTTLLERLPPGFQNVSSFSWSPNKRWVTFSAGSWPDVAVYLWHWEVAAEPYRLLPGSVPQWQPGF